jgi:lipopolysaccharide/colanic/teichoic acid biosynthesis glycosyltransferase
VRRALDVVVSLAVLLLTLPLLLVLALAIRLDSPGPVLLRQKRLGRGGVPFPMLKFRTMYIGADQLLEQRLAADAEARHTWHVYQKLACDPRTTRVGRLLRRYSVDELPQIWNIVRGEMSLVGPRPILPEQRTMYGDAFATYARMRPGVTGLWQVSGRNRLSFAERVTCDERYSRCCSMGLDLRIIVRTVAVLVRPDGAC